MRKRGCLSLRLTPCSFLSFFLLSKNSLCLDSPSQRFLRFMAAGPSFFLGCTHVVPSSVYSSLSGREHVLEGSPGAEMISGFEKVPLLGLGAEA